MKTNIVDSGAKSKKIEVEEFLSQTPPNTPSLVSWPTYNFRAQYGNQIRLTRPDLKLHCSNEKCSGSRIFRSTTEHIVEPNRFVALLKYKCSNCDEDEKIFAVAIAYEDITSQIASCVKLGELPAFGPLTPARVISLIGPDRDLLLKGRKCENLGLGVGAYVYYRRVIEQQKNRIIDEIIKVIKKESGSDVDVTAFEAAKQETQFSNAIDSIQELIPRTLYINKSNPLKLLHSTLSQGVHELSDEECLEQAHAIRVVLIEFSERLAEILRNDSELNAAISSLIRSKQSPK